MRRIMLFIAFVLASCSEPKELLILEKIDESPPKLVAVFECTWDEKCICSVFYEIMFFLNFGQREKVNAVETNNFRYSFISKKKLINIILRDSVNVNKHNVEELINKYKISDCGLRKSKSL